MNLILGIGEYGYVDSPGDTIKTLALGSCLGIVVFSRKSPLIGMLHAQLPESAINPKMAAERPGMFVDTGIPLLLQPFLKLGGNPRDTLIKLVGAAQIMDPENKFNIGKRNYLTAKKILWANKLWPNAEDIGGDFSRSATAAVGSFSVILHTPGRQDWEI